MYCSGSCVPSTVNAMSADICDSALAERYIVLAIVFRIFTFELDVSDASMAHAYLVPYPKSESKWMQVTIRSVGA